MTEIRIVVCESLPDKAELSRILAQYYDLAVKRMGEMGFDLDPAAPQSALAEFWAKAEEYLPPNGCLVVARDQDDELVGCAMMKRLDPETGELKRLFVADSARGTGTGRKLTEAQIEVARRMGLKRIVADSLTPSVEIRGLVPKLGFTEVQQPIETTTYIDQPMLRPHLHYFTMDIAAPDPQ